MVGEINSDCINKISNLADIKKANHLCTPQLTSTKVGHDFIPPVNVKQQVLTLKVPQELRVLSVPLKEEAYKTNYNEGMEWHYNTNDPVDRANHMSGLRLQYIKPYAEVVKVNPPKPHQAPLSEFQDKYTTSQIYPPKSKVVNLRPTYICQIQDSNKDQQPPLKTDSDGYCKHLDIYISNSHFNHRPFHPLELEEYKSKPFLSDTTVSSRSKPVYDASVFKEKYQEKILPKVSRPVPHSGMESEMKSKYRLPFDDLSSVRIKIPTIIPPFSRPTKAEILSTPAMYHTEYNHLGTKWPLSAVIVPAKSSGVVKD